MKIIIFLAGLAAILTVAVSCSIADNSSSVTSASTIVEPVLTNQDGPIVQDAVMLKLMFYRNTNFAYFGPAADAAVYQQFYGSYYPEVTNYALPMEADITARQPALFTFQDVESRSAWYQKAVYPDGTVSYTNAVGDVKTVWADGSKQIVTSERHYDYYPSGKQLYVTNLASGVTLSIWDNRLIEWKVPGGFYYLKWTNGDGSDYYKLVYTNGRAYYKWRSTDFKAVLPFGELDYYQSGGVRYIFFTNGMTNYLWDSGTALQMCLPDPVTNTIFANGKKAVYFTNHYLVYYTNGNTSDNFPDGGVTRTSRMGGVVNCYDSNWECTNTALTANWKYSSNYIETAHFFLDYQPGLYDRVTQLVYGTSNIENMVYDPDRAFFNNLDRKNKPHIVFFASSNDLMEFFGLTNWMPGGFDTGENIIAIPPGFTNTPDAGNFQTLRHEYCHDDLCYVLRGGSIPYFVNEGTAQVAEIYCSNNNPKYLKALTNTWTNRLSNSLLQWDLIATNSFGALPLSAAQQAYDQSLSFLFYLYKNHGNTLLPLIYAFTNSNIGGYSMGNYIPAFSSVYGSFSAEEAAWKASLPSAQ